LLKEEEVRDGKGEKGMRRRTTETEENSACPIMKINVEGSTREAQDPRGGRRRDRGRKKTVS